MFEPPAALIFRQKLLRYSETFIAAQARHLQAFTPHFVGVSRVHELPLDDAATTCVAGPGRLGALHARTFALTRSAGGLVPRLRRLNPAVMHAHFEDAAMLALPIARALQLPLVTTLHGYDATMDDRVRWPNPVLRALHQSRRGPLTREGDLFIAVSDYIRQKAIARGYPEDRVITHHIGVDTEAFQPPVAPRDGRTILFVGRLVEKKGCAYLLDALGPVCAKFPDAELVVLGSGPLRESLERRAREARLRVRFLGAVDSATVREHMSRAAVLVAPSVTAESGDSEGLPIVICEAQAMGLPVVAFEHSGIPEVVIHEITGYLVPERDVQGLRERILQLLGRAPLREMLGRSARSQIEENFDLRKQTAHLEALYGLATYHHFASPKHVTRTPDFRLLAAR
jgi:glycosyltransferase involved in cell wall biosynthesis